MKKVLSILLAAVFLLAFAGLGSAQRKSVQGTKREAKAMVEKATEWFQKYGRAKTLAEISRAGTEKRGAFIDRDLYIFAYDFRGVCVAHGANPKLVGKHLIDLQDADGRYLIRGLINTARKGQGWYYYKWSNPITKKIDDKMAYVRKLDDSLWIGCGVYGREAQVKQIGVLTLVEQTRYDEALQGIRDRLAEEGYEEPAVSFRIGNAHGSNVRAEELIHGFLADKMDLVIAFGTNAAVAVAKDIKNIPVLFSKVYDPVAAGIAGSLKSSGNNTTGTSTRIPMSVLVGRLKGFAPVRKLAVLYSPGEKDSVQQFKELRDLQTAYHIRVVPVPVAKRDEVTAILPEIVHTSDAIYLTGSSVVGATAATIAEESNKAKVVTITHLDDLVGKGVLLGVTGDSYNEGLLAGRMAVAILRGAKPSSIPIEPPKTLHVFLNMKSAKAGGFRIPTAFIESVTNTVD